MESARPLEAQPYDKGKVWLLLVGGAAGLFVATVALENNEAFFPAISRANQAMSNARRQTEGSEASSSGSSDLQSRPEEAANYEEVRQKAEAFARSEEAVLRGLQEARRAVLAESEAVAAQLQGSLEATAAEGAAASGAPPNSKEGPGASGEAAGSVGGTKAPAATPAAEASNSPVQSRS